MLTYGRNIYKNLYKMTKQNLNKEKQSESYKLYVTFSNKILQAKE